MRCEGRIRVPGSVDMLGIRCLANHLDRRNFKCVDERFFSVMSFLVLNVAAHLRYRALTERECAVRALPLEEVITPNSVRDSMGAYALDFSNKLCNSNLG